MTVSGYVCLATSVVDERGRIVIPAEMRRNAELSAGGTVVLSQTVKGLIIVEKKE